MAQSKLSIILVTYNSYPFLLRCLESIPLGGLDKNAYEIIVVDNASSDETIEEMKKRKDIHLLVNTSNTGFAAANNQAIKHAKGAYILFLNPDTILRKNSLKRILSFMQENTRASIATCNVSLPSGEIDDACHRGFPTPWNALCHFSGLSHLFPKSLFFNGYHLGYRNLDVVHEIDSCAGAYMMVRKSAGDAISWFDEEYFWYGEDIDFCFRMKETGGHVFFIPDVSILHYKGISSGIKAHSQEFSTATRETKQQATEARFAVMNIFYRKHYQQRYPKWVTLLVLGGIWMRKQFAFFQL